MVFFIHFWCMNFVCLNGKFFQSDVPVFAAQNRGFKYGDGVFETMRVVNGETLLATFHFERLLLSLRMLKINLLPGVSADLLTSEILALCQKNNCSRSARVRLAFFRNGDNNGEYVIEATSVPKEAGEWNDTGVVLGLFPFSRKNCDAYSNLKTANFLPYVLASIHAKENTLDDCVVLNAENNVCDTSKANIFLIKKNKIITPALQQGCINGVMRRYIIEELKKQERHIYQEAVTERDVLDADEIFLTNAIFRMRWVKKYKMKEYTSTGSEALYKSIFKDYPTNKDALSE